MHCWKLCLHEERVGRCKIPAETDYMSMLTILILPPPSIIWLVCGETPPPPSYLAGMVAYLCKLCPGHCFINIQNLCHMDFWSAWLVLTHYQHFPPTPPSQEPHKRESKLTLFLRLSLAYFLRFLGCLELFSNSHLRVLRECSPWVGLH